MAFQRGSSPLMQGAGAGPQVHKNSNNKLTEEHHKFMSERM